MAEPYAPLHEYTPRTRLCWVVRGRECCARRRTGCVTGSAEEVVGRGGDEAMSVVYDVLTGGASGHGVDEEGVEWGSASPMHGSPVPSVSATATSSSSSPGGGRCSALDATSLVSASGSGTTETTSSLWNASEQEWLRRLQQMLSEVHNGARQVAVLQDACATLGRTTGQRCPTEPIDDAHTPPWVTLAMHHANCLRQLWTHEQRGNAALRAAFTQMTEESVDRERVWVSRGSAPDRPFRVACWVVLALVRWRRRWQQRTARAESAHSTRHRGSAPVASAVRHPPCCRRFESLARAVRHDARRRLRAYQRALAHLARNVYTQTPGNDVDDDDDESPPPVQSTTTRHASAAPLAQRLARMRQQLDSRINARRDGKRTHSHGSTYLHHLEAAQHLLR
eukprot:ctg_735.g360